MFMTHPIYDALAAIHDMRRCEVFYLIGTVFLGVWRPREDLPPCIDAEVAEAVAREETIKQEMLHQARMFKVSDGTK